MSLVDRIKQNYENKQKGILNYIPFSPLGKVTDWFPGWMRGELSCITGTPASSKTQLLKRWCVIDPVKFARKSGKDVKIIWFGLEETQVQFEYSLMALLGYEMFGMRYNIRNFEFIGKEVNPSDFPKLDQVEERKDQIMKYITYYDSIYNPFGFHTTIRKFAAERGTFYLKGVPLLDTTDMTSGWDQYTPDNPEEFVIVVLDNTSFIHKEKGHPTDKEAIDATIEYLRSYAVKQFNYSVVVVQHQDSVSENQESRKAKEVLPTLQGLAKSKETQRAYLNVIGIANLNRTNTVGDNTGIQTWNGVNIVHMGNFARVINILKNRYGVVDVNDTVYTDGRVGHFQTIDRGKLNDLYQHIKRISNE